jgi:hypothetical protein
MEKMKKLTYDLEEVLLEYSVNPERGRLNGEPEMFRGSRVGKG